MTSSPDTGGIGPSWPSAIGRGFPDRRAGPWPRCQAQCPSAPRRADASRVPFATGDNPDARLAGYLDGWTRPTRSLLSRDVLDALGDWTPGQALEEGLQELPGRVDPLDRMLSLEQRHFLADHNLNYNDKMGMACGLEVRVPFLDLDLVRFANSLPANFKQKGARQGGLGDALRGVLPDATLNRSKTGFAVPLRSWIRGALRPRLEELANRTRADSGLLLPARHSGASRCGCGRRR